MGRSRLDSTRPLRCRQEPLLGKNPDCRLDGMNRLGDAETKSSVGRLGSTERQPIPHRGLENINESERPLEKRSILFIRQPASHLPFRIRGMNFIVGVVDFISSPRTGKPTHPPLPKQHQQQQIRREQKTPTAVKWPKLGVQSKSTPVCANNPLPIRAPMSWILWPPSAPEDRPTRPTCSPTLFHKGASYDTSSPTGMACCCREGPHATTAIDIRPGRW